jgi:fructose-bisphosphate aldolase class I
MNAMRVTRPWRLSCSFARALQGPAIDAWRGEPAHVPAAQQALHHRAQCNGAASEGRYATGLEQAPDAPPGRRG